MLNENNGSIKFMIGLEIDDELNVKDYRITVELTLRGSLRKLSMTIPEAKLLSRMIDQNAVNTSCLYEFELVGNYLNVDHTTTECHYPVELVDGELHVDLKDFRAGKYKASLPL
jgi:hypothetical protein